MLSKPVKIILYIVVAVVVIAVICKLMKKKEGYAEVMIAPTYDKFMVSRPGFRADLPPRFDPFRMSGGNIKASFPGFSKQGAGITPLSDNEGACTKESCQGSKEGFDDIDTADCNTGPSKSDKGGDFSSLGLMSESIAKYKKGCDAVKEDAQMKFRSAQGYADPDQLLPQPDVRQCLMDPSDPENYMYDRTIFAPLKRRNGSIGVDFVRGDLYIPPINTGWFYAPTIPSVDLQRAAVNILNSSIDNEDIIYSNSKPIVVPTEQQQESIWENDPNNKMKSPWGIQSLHRE